MRRVVITGLGVISCIGNNKEEVLSSLKSGRSGITFNQSYKDYGFRSCVSGSVKDLDLQVIPREYLRFMSDSAAYGYIATQQAIKDAALTDEMLKSDRTGLIIGSGGGSPLNVSLSVDALREKGVKRIGPYAVPKVMSSVLSANLAVAFGIRGISYSISSACATGLHSIGNAAEMIQYGKQDMMIAGGAEEENWTLSCLFDAMGALSSKRNDNPTAATRPYDSDRDGFVIAGGAGVVVLESLESAQKRGAKIYAEITGYGASSDGYDMVAPSGEGAMRCMKLALGDNYDVDYVNTHGTSTVVGDKAEYGAIKETFGAKIPDFSSTKSMTGHSLGAAGAHEIIYCLLMMEEGFIAPSINVDNLGEEFVGAPLITSTKKKSLNRVLTNSFGFGGTNGAMLVEKVK